MDIVLIGQIKLLERIETRLFLAPSRESFEMQAESGRRYA
jgi:hypothetical protein